MPYKTSLKKVQQFMSYQVHHFFAPYRIGEKFENPVPYFDADIDRHQNPINSSYGQVQPFLPNPGPLLKFVVIVSRKLL